MNMDHVIVALDHTDMIQNYRLMDMLAGHVKRIKIGSIVFSHEGPKVLAYARDKGFSIFLDLKFYDIPHTVSKAVKAICTQVPIEMLTVHASGGAEMIRAVSQEVKGLPADRQPKILAVTVLTSFDQQQYWHAGYAAKDIEQHVLDMGTMAKEAGADGLVCSAWEVKKLRSKLGDGLLYVVPGIRMPSDGHDDQKRVMTPVEAAANGATYLVMGRSITASENPMQVIENIKELM